MFCSPGIGNIDGQEIDEADVREGTEYVETSECGQRAMYISTFFMIIFRSKSNLERACDGSEKEEEERGKIALYIQLEGGRGHAKGCPEPCTTISDGPKSGEWVTYKIKRPHTQYEYRRKGEQKLSR